MQKTLIFRWQDRSDRSYAVLHMDGGHFRVAWGTCDPPQSDNFAEQGAHTTSVLEEAIKLLLEHVHAQSDASDEVERVEPRLRAALREAAV
jgi:hypothetical protein